MEKLNSIKKIACSFCGELKLRTAKFDENNSRYFTDPTTELRWKGRVCPGCIDLDEDDSEPTIKLTGRKCRDCSTYLPENRYFKCEVCQPALPSIGDEFIYEAPGLDEFTANVAEVLDSGDKGNWGEHEHTEREEDDRGDASTGESQSG